MAGTRGAGVDSPWWRGAVLYQIYPRSFADSDGDGVGDLPGIVARLDHVASLGVDGVWLSPVFSSPMADFGYDISDYRGIDPLFGTLADFDRLVARAHELGLKLIIDQVYSHTSDAHPWFLKDRAPPAHPRLHQPRKDWYVWADPKPDGGPPNNWLSVFGGSCWTWDARRGQYYFHNFLPQQPDLNLHNPEVQDALLAVARFWLDRGVDGFRLDALNFAMHDRALTDNPVAPPDRRRRRPFDYQDHVHSQSQPEIVGFVERLAATVADYPNRFTVAEVGGPTPLAEMRAFTTGPERLDTAYGFGFLAAPRLTPQLVRAELEAWPDGEDEPWPSWAFSNHDAPRAVSRWAEGRDEVAVARLLIALLACLRGTVFLFQGEELGLPQAEVPFERLRDPEAITNWPLTLGRDGARTPMVWTAAEEDGGFTTGEPWLPVDPRHLALAVDRQEADPASPLQLTRAMLALRRREPALRLGAAEFVDSPGDLLVFRRSWQDRTLTCAFNLGHAGVDWTTGGETLAALNGATDKWLPPLAATVSA